MRVDLQGHSFPYQPGQALLIADHGFAKQRPYSIAGAPEDAARDGLQKTPHRVAKMYREMLSGYGQDIETILNGALFEVAYGAGEMIVVADIGSSAQGRADDDCHHGWGSR